MWYLSACLWNALFRWKKLQDEDLSDMTEVVVSDMDLGLEEDTITTYWLSYDRLIGFLIYCTANARENRHYFFI
jgi:hypothetical protein